MPGCAPNRYTEGGVLRRLELFVSIMNLKQKKNSIYARTRRTRSEVSDDDEGDDDDDANSVGAGAAA